MRLTLYFLFALLLITGCNKDDLITEEVSQAPVIELDSETGIYTIKVGRELTIEPTYKYADNALYTWTIDGKLISSDPVLKYTWEQEQELYIKLRVDTKNGYAEEELKVEVLELTPPVISLVIPSKGLKVMQNTDYIIAPDIQNEDLEGFCIEWIRDGEVVGLEKTYTFHEKKLGTYPITIRASNIDGETTRDLDIEVVETMPYAVWFPTPSHTQISTDRYTFAGRPVYLRPMLEYFDYPHFQWSVNGEIVDTAEERVFKFTPETSGEYIVAVTVSEETPSTQQLSRNIMQANTSITATVKVICEKVSEGDRCRTATASCSRLWNKVYEYTPAPGQFINEPKAEFTGNEITPEAAVEYATKRLENRKYVSLGSWGGYIIVGFDHSIKNSGSGYDFAIEGNAFNSSSGGSNEPGIVWVMQDINGNGLPDDEWYELKGSETGKAETLQDYEVTYYKPESAGSKVNWTDSEGQSGWVDFLGAYHWQDYYYPLWIKDRSYTFIGTRLLARNRQDISTGFWSNEAYEWGYVDNKGTDDLGDGDSVDGNGQRNGFKISNAIYHDGSPVNLQYIDFVKVQCGVLAKSGWLGEISTEVFSFEDLTITY